MTNQKDTLRSEARKHRARMDIRQEDPEDACHLFFETIKPQAHHVVAAYWPKSREFDVHPIIDRLFEEGIECALPVVHKGQIDLGFAHWEEGEPLEKGEFGVMTPLVNENTKWVEPDIVIVPFLAFDRKGYRLGYGNGHYDATLNHLRQRKEIVAVGIGFAQDACLFPLPSEEHDEKMDWVITPQEAHYFGD